MGKKHKPDLLNVDKWIEDRTNELVKETWAFFDRTGGVGAITLIYRETTDQHDGAVDVIPTHIDIPLVWFNSGVTIRGNLTKEQAFRVYHEKIRQLPVLPIERRGVSK